MDNYDCGGWGEGYSGVDYKINRSTQRSNLGAGRMRQRKPRRRPSPHAKGTHWEASWMLRRCEAGKGAAKGEMAVDGIRTPDGPQSVNSGDGMELGEALKSAKGCGCQESAGWRPRRAGLEAGGGKPPGGACQQISCASLHS